jgi:hypothetical protein
MKTVDVVAAEYSNAFVLKVNFSDGSSKLVDFGKFLKKHSHPQFDKYKDIETFRNFKIEMGNIVWGENWDLIFPVSQLYKGKISV